MGSTNRRFGSGRQKRGGLGRVDKKVRFGSGRVTS